MSVPVHIVHERFVVPPDMIRRLSVTQYHEMIRAGILTAVYWIVNLLDRRVEVYSDPSGAVRLPDYRRRQDYAVEEAVPVVVDGREVARIPAREFLL